MKVSSRQVMLSWASFYRFQCSPLLISGCQICWNISTASVMFLYNPSIAWFFLLYFLLLELRNIPCHGAYYIGCKKYPHSLPLFRAGAYNQRSMLRSSMCRTSHGGSRLVPHHKWPAHDDQIEYSQWFYAPAWKMGPNRYCNHHYTLHNSPSYGAIVHGEGYRSWMDARSQEWFILCHGFLRLFSFGEGGGLPNFKDNYWSHSTCLDPSGYTGFVFGLIPIFFPFWQCHYRFAFSFMHSIPMWVFVVFFSLLFSLDCRYLEIATCRFGGEWWTWIARLPRPLLLCSMGTLVLICRAWCMTV